jgi:hypothetical protein
MTHATRSSFKHTIPAKHVFGTVEELEHRVGGTLAKLPDNAPSTFRQIGPDAGGGNMNDHKVNSQSGESKWGNPRKYA